MSILSLRIGKKTRTLVDWCHIFDVPYNSAWNRYTQGERDPLVLFKSKHRTTEDLAKKIASLSKDRPKPQVAEVVEEPVEQYLEPVQVEIPFVQTRDVMLVDVLGEELMSELRRECRYHMGMPLTQAVHDAVVRWVADAKVARDINRKQYAELAEAERQW